MKTKYIKDHLIQHNKAIQILLKDKSIQDKIIEVVDLIALTFSNANKLMIAGNGGSAADAQHIAAEFVGRYKIERKGLSAIALTTDSSALTAIGNDYGYERVFDRQVEALAHPNDVVIGISTGGTSINVINAFNIAREIGCKTIGFSGRSGGQMNECCDINIVVPAEDTARIQEMHILFGHILCHLIDLDYINKK
jgi:D-sedoheptulose 7-phosphate isomerase